MMKIGIIGTGFIITEALTAMSEVPEIELTAILARPHSVEKGRAFAEKFGIGKLYTERDCFVHKMWALREKFVHKMWRLVVDYVHKM